MSLPADPKSTDEVWGACITCMLLLGQANENHKKATFVRGGNMSAVEYEESLARDAANAKALKEKWSAHLEATGHDPLRGHALRPS